jgi:hypothetical protein
LEHPNIVKFHRYWTDTHNDKPRVRLETWNWQSVKRIDVLCHTDCPSENIYTLYSLICITQADTD